MSSTSHSLRVNIVKAIISFPYTCLSCGGADRGKARKGCREDDLVHRGHFLPS